MGSSKRARIPPPPAPAPTPTALDDEVLERDRARRRQRMAAAGRSGTIITEGGLGSLGASKKGTLLGGSA